MSNTDGFTCPHCGQREVFQGSPQHVQATDTILIHAQCDSCGAEWDAHYALVFIGISDLTGVP